MKDTRKTKKQLIGELTELRQHTAKLETDSRRVAEALRESEASVKSILMAAPIGIGLVQNRILEWVSERMNEMLGYSGYELIGKSARLLYENDEEFERVGREKYQEIHEEGIGKIETRWRGKDGSMIDVHLRSTPIDPADLSQGVIFTALDITESKQAQKALRESKDRYRRITEAITDYIFTVRVANGHPAETIHGPSCEAVTGYTTEEFSSDPFLWIRMVPEEDQEVVRGQASDILAGHNPQPIEHRIVRKDGRIRWVSNSIVPNYDIQGNLISYDGLIRDITKRKRAEETVRESEERYRQLVETMNEGLAMADENYVFKFINERFSEMLGYSREEMIDHHILEFVHEDYTDLFREQMASRRRGEARSYEIDWRAKDGSRVHTLISPKGFYDAEGQFTGSLGVLTDITDRKRAEEALQRAHAELEHRVQERTAELLQTNEQLKREIEDRKRAEEELRESETRYRLLINNIPSIVYRGYKDWSVDFMDEKIRLLTGYGMEEFNSRRMKWSDVIVKKDIETAKQALVAALKTDKSYIREYRVKTKAGDTLWVQDRGYVVCDKDGEIEYVSGVFFDVTERKRLEKTIVQREKLNTLGAITAEVAHEIRNPLVSIGGFARRLQHKFPNLPESHIILQESRRLEKILSRIRNYLKPVEVHPQECSVNNIISDCVHLLSPETELRKIRCQLDLYPNLSAVYTDPDILTQIFVNLILNAAEAMDQGGNLIVKTFETEQDLHVEFKNPISEPATIHSELLFMPFAEGGESIGLPLCYRMLKNMGGLLSFAPEKDYMVFTVSLPKTIKPHLEKESLKAETG
ncbi:MAG: PAS domain S-box protein [Deltaproteobacteria bacterium]|nr:MAG: PAS domain S-box protein [Deltaproteobacteria bacterium]